MPTGPTIVICLTVIVVASLVFAPNRGLLWGWVRQHRQSRDLRARVVMADLYALSRQHGDTEYGHSISALKAMSAGRVAVDHGLEDLESAGLARQIDPDHWVLTDKGLEQAHREHEERERE